MMLQNDLLLRAARGQYVERPPVWLMRQAGRVLPEYRAVRERLKNFIELVTTPELAAEVTIQPVDLLGVDAAIIFSDILVIPEAMGLPYEMLEKRGPIFPQTIRSEQDLQKIRVADAPSDLGYVAEAIRITKRALSGRVPLIGFAGAPFTIFAYMTEGSGSKTFSTAKKILYRSPELSHKLLQMITDSTIGYLKMQIAAGADLVQLFDSWAGILSPAQYRTFALPYIAQICNAINEVPVTIFAKGAFFALTEFAQLKCHVIGLDWNIEPTTARQQIGNQKTLQGNLDPCTLYADFDTIRKETQKMVAAFGKQHYIANLGHGLYPDIEPDHVRCFVDTIKSLA
ncbi:MAG: uroporphyrinogen decarboxylase [Cytophagales bacterium]|nr:uroporphyrinogen decarboxylase [Bernardetiaceae bacterium]MDW8204322.1 uroporphyrinogen decarboxylase [Cytophagales bacterium]